MQDQIRILKKDLTEANEQIAGHKAGAPPAAAMATIPAPAAAAAAAAQAPTAAPARHIYQEYGEEPNFYRPPRHVASSAAKKATSCELSYPPGPSTPPPPASTRQRPRPASRTNTGAANP